MLPSLFCREHDFRFFPSFSFCLRLFLVALSYTFHLLRLSLFRYYHLCIVQSLKRLTLPSLPLYMILHAITSTRVLKLETYDSYPA